MKQALKQRVSEFKGQNFSNTAWAFASVKQPDANLFTLLARVAERWVSEFSTQDLANTAWAFATLKQLDENLLTSLAIAVEQRVGEGSLLLLLLWQNHAGWVVHEKC